VAPERVQVTGSVKFDGVVTDRRHSRTEALRRLVAVTDEDVVWVAGSTQAPEEEIVLRVYEQVRADYPRLRLFLVPRHKDRFDEVARLLKRSSLPFVRRSGMETTQPPNHPTTQPPILLVDTIGELGALWGLADVAFVGGSLDGWRGGQNMIEPAAVGAAVVFGPHVWNFRDTAARLVAAGGAVQVEDADGLGRVVRRLLDAPAERKALGVAANALVRSQQGATVRTLALLEGLVGRETVLPRSRLARGA
jgi:3-deoxy-D-manno-octulosonic-acid transferase